MDHLNRGDGTPHKEIALARRPVLQPGLEYHLHLVELEAASSRAGRSLSAHAADRRWDLTVEKHALGMKPAEKS